MPGLAHLKMKYVEEFGSSQNESMIREKLRFLHHVRINNNFLIPKFRTEKSTKPNWARIETIFCCLYYKVFHHYPHYEFHRKDKMAFLYCRLHQVKNNCFEAKICCFVAARRRPGLRGCQKRFPKWDMNHLATLPRRRKGIKNSERFFKSILRSHLLHLSPTKINFLYLQNTLVGIPKYWNTYFCIQVVLSLKYSS